MKRQNNNYSHNANNGTVTIDYNTCYPDPELSLWAHQGSKILKDLGYCHLGLILKWYH